jgi:hypothetical protein
MPVLNFREVAYKMKAGKTFYFSFVLPFSFSYYLDKKISIKTFFC